MTTAEIEIEIGRETEIEIEIETAAADLEITIEGSALPNAAVGAALRAASGLYQPAIAPVLAPPPLLIPLQSLILKTPNAPPRGHQSVVLRLVLVRMEMPPPRRRQRARMATRWRESWMTRRHRCRL